MDEYATKVNAVFQRSMPLTMHKFHEMLNSRFFLAAGDPSENRWGCMSLDVPHIFTCTHTEWHTYTQLTCFEEAKSTIDRPLVNIDRHSNRHLIFSRQDAGPVKTALKKKEKEPTNYIKGESV